MLLNFFLDQAALRKAIRIVEGLNQQFFSHKMLKMTSSLKSEIGSLGILGDQILQQDESGSLKKEF